MRLLRTVFVSFLVFAVACSAQKRMPDVTGELREWHRVSLTFDGPQSDETSDPNPFLYYRLRVTFRQHDRSYAVPGFFAADGDAANTGATGGNKWRVHFCPDKAGVWDYTVSFRKGKEAAVSEDPEAGTPVSPVDGFRGSLEIESTNKTGSDHRAKGRLQYVGGRYLRYAGSGEYFLKQGADAPENFLAYADFDGDFKTDGQKDRFVKSWEAHARDWQAGDPAWGNGRGKGMIGALNYLAGKGMNAFSFIPMNIGGDDRNVFPYLNYEERYRLDVSRLAQWEIVFNHADKLGLYLHFKTQETENELLLDGGDLGTARRLYYRELIARFGHHLAMNWNLGEEINNASTEQKKAWAEYFYHNDPYHHHIVIHNGANHYDLLGPDSRLTGFSLQTNKSDFSRVHERVLNYIKRSGEAGKPWVVACDEPGDASHSLVPDSDDPLHDNPRKNGLWGTIMAGGAGNEWYFGYKHAHSDLTCQDWRSRDKWWDQCRIALDFFRNNIPFWQMVSADGLTTAEEDFCFADPGRFYVIYLPCGGSTEVGLGSGTYKVAWFNPRKGGEMQDGSVTEAAGPAIASVGTPPEDPEKDWTVLVSLTDGDGSDIEVPEAKKQPNL